MRGGRTGSANQLHYHTDINQSIKSALNWTAPEQLGYFKFNMTLMCFFSFCILMNILLSFLQTLLNLTYLSVWCVWWLLNLWFMLKWIYQLNHIKFFLQIWWPPPPTHTIGVWLYFLWHDASNHHNFGWSLQEVIRSYHLTQLMSYLTKKEKWLLKETPNFWRLE